MNYLQAYDNRTVLVTGGAGAIGSNLCRRLAELGAQVIILDDLSSGVRWNVPSLPGVLFVEGDILDEVKLKRVFFERPEIVFHLAAFFANQNSVDHPERDLMVNGLGTLRLLEYSVFTGVERFVYAHAWHITVLSEGFRANLLRKGVPSEKLTIIPNFVDVDFIRPLPRANGFHHRFGLDGRFMVLYAGNLGHSQNLEHVLECAALLQDRNDIAFVIVGNGSRKPYLEALAQQMKLHNVQFVPFQPRKDVPSIYAAADISLVTLRKGIALESVASKAYTIMASARPILAAVDPGSDAWELVQRAECRLCVKPENRRAMPEAIWALYADPAWRECLGRNGRRHVVQH